jgi:hypothetical protein
MDKMLRAVHADSSRFKSVLIHLRKVTVVQGNIKTCSMYSVFM